MSGIVRASAHPPVTDRTCGSCTLCCKVMQVDALGKPAGKWCPHCAPGRGCKIYETRPQECRTFNCAWIMDARLGPHWKPEKCKFLLIAKSDGSEIEVRCDSGFPTAWRVAPYYAQILQWAREVAALEGTLIVYVGRSGTLVTPDAEFPLGEIGANDRIVREVAGGRVVRAFVERGAAGRN
jgi:hypothetical protein